MRVSGPQGFVRGAVLCASALLSAVTCRAQGLIAGMAKPVLPSSAVDAGTLPGTQVVPLTIYLAPSADRAVALDSYLEAVQTPGSPQYHQWMTPAAFAAQFGASANQVAAVTAWAMQQGLAVQAVAASGMSIQLTGTATQVEAAMAPGLHAMQVAGLRYLANTAVPSLPDAMAAQVLAIDGLNTVPSAYPATVRTEAGRFAAPDVLAAVTKAVEANSSRVLSISSAACTDDVDAATGNAMHLLLKQAAAQGITVLAASGCNGRASASYPGSLAELVSVATNPGITPATSPTLTELQPDWQNTPGVPRDGFRHEPDLTVTSLAEMEGAVLAILAKQPAPADGSAARLGNIASTLYSLAPTPGIWSQPNGATDTWTATTGLGITDLHALISHYPDGVNAVQVSIMQPSNVYSTTYGTDVSYTVTVRDPNSANTPGGSVTVTFSPNGYSTTLQLSPTQTPFTSQATFSLSQLPTFPLPASYTLTASYAGDTNFAGGTGSTTLYVNAQALQLTATASGSPVVGGTYTVQVNVVGANGSPTGTLVVTPSPGTAQTSAFTGTNGSYTLTDTFTATQAGQVSINVQCNSATTAYTCYSTNTNITVGKASTTTSVTLPSGNPVYGQSTKLTATITGAGSTLAAPTGTVTFTDQNNNQLCTAYASAGTGNGTASCTTTTLSGTVSNTVTATYQGDGNYNGSSGTASYTGAQISTTVTLTASKSAVVVNGSVTLTATVVPATALNNLPPTGTVTFSSAAGQLSVQTLSGNSGTVTATVQLPTQGTQTITATYSGDTNYTGSTSKGTNVVVGPATSVAITTVPTGNIVYGNTIALTAVVSGTPTDGSATLNGNVTFKIDGTDHITVAGQTSNNTGTTLTSTATVTQALDAGVYTVTLVCGSGTNFDCSNIGISGSATFTIAKAPTTTTLQLSSSTLTGGSTITATATVAPTTKATGTAGVITGTVVFYDNGTAVSTQTLSTSDQASATFTLSSAGGDNIVAVYSGDGNNSSSQSNGSTTGTGGGSTSNPSSTAITVSASPLSALSGASVAVTAVVTATLPSGSTGTAGNPAGTVYFYDNYNGTQFLLGTQSLSAGGVSSSTAVLYTTALRPGANMVTAAFLGNSGYSASSTATGPTVQITDYTVTFNSTSVNVTAGQSVTVPGVVNAVNGFTGQVVLGCAAPAGSATTCTFDKTLVQTSGVVNLTITTTVRTAYAAVRRGFVEAGIGAGAVLLLLLVPGARRRKLRLLAMVATVAVGSTLGCTNIVNGPTGSGLGSGTPAGTEVLTITTSGTDGVTTVRHNYQISVNVQ